MKDIRGSGTLPAAVADPNAYEYGPLESVRHFRLLRLTRVTQVITYSIVTYSLDNCPEYETVSYVWGEPERCRTIVLEDGRTLFVTASLDDALASVAKACEVGYLWIDQLTINQADITERSAQVKIMGEIYRRSSRCLIWLNSYEFHGVDSSDWGRGVGAAVQRFFECLCEDAFGRESRKTSFAEGAQEFGSALTPSGSWLTADVKEHILWFLEHPWFKRTWVYQEFVLSPTPVFLIDDFQLSGNEVEKAFDVGWLRSAAWYDCFDRTLNVTGRRASIYRESTGCRFLVSVARSRLIMSKPFDVGRAAINAANFEAYEVLTFSDVLDEMADNEAQDNRDHVYGFLGLAPNLLRNMDIDYSTSVEQAFAAMMKAMVKDAKSLDLLDFARTEADLCRSKLNLPSWCPDWTFTTSRIQLLCQDNMFDAAGAGYGLPTITACQHEDSPTSAWYELEVAGKIIDEVMHRLESYSIYQMFSNLNIDPAKCSGRLPWERSTIELFMAEMAERNYPEGPYVSREALLRTLFVDGAYWAAWLALHSSESLHRIDIKVDGLPHKERVKDLIAALLSDDCDFDDLPHDGDLAILHELSKAQYQRRIACCKTGRLALAPDRVQGGDQIMLLHGSRTPIVLRPMPNGRYVVIGACYYDGAMYGELADPVDEHARTFKLI